MHHRTFSQDQRRRELDWLEAVWRQLLTDGKAA